jgi:hypothetical protein
MAAMLVKLFVPLMVLGFISPIAAIIASCILFTRHRDRDEPKGRVPLIGFIIAAGICGAIGGYFGLAFGVAWACPEMGNLCGLWGVFVTAPICFALGILLVGIVVSLIRPAPRPDTR